MTKVHDTKAPWRLPSTRVDWLLLVKKNLAIGLSTLDLDKTSFIAAPLLSSMKQLQLRQSRRPQNVKSFG